MTDREIIQKLATKFFGWQFTDASSVIGKHLMTDTTTTVWYWCENGNVGVAGTTTFRDFDPLHDPASCALIKAELRRKKYITEITMYSDIVSIELTDEDLQTVAFEKADTEERAVCLAVLAACGVETD